MIFGSVVFRRCNPLFNLDNDNRKIKHTRIEKVIVSEKEYAEEEINEIINNMVKDKKSISQLKRDIYFFIRKVLKNHIPEVWENRYLNKKAEDAEYKEYMRLKEKFENPHKIKVHDNIV